MIKDKTYFASLKEHIFQIPKIRIYHKDRIGSGERRTASPPSLTYRTQSDFLSAKPTAEMTKTASATLSAFHKNSPSYHYLKRHKEDDHKPPTKVILEKIFNQPFSNRSLSQLQSTRGGTTSGVLVRDESNQYGLTQQASVPRIAPKTSMGVLRIPVDKIV